MCAAGPCDVERQILAAPLIVTRKVLTPPRRRVSYQRAIQREVLAAATGVVGYVGASKGTSQ